MAGAYRSDIETMLQAQQTIVEMLAGMQRQMDDLSALVRMKAAQKSQELNGSAHGKSGSSGGTQ